jgi:methylmalonyl-CoA mutase cobalamin-binding subunit
MAEKQNRKKRILKHLRNVGMAIISVSLRTSPVSAVDPAEAAGQVIGAEGGPKAAKEALNAALRMAKSKPAMSTATGIVCLACIPTAGATASIGLCIACGILIAKTFG